MCIIYSSLLLTLVKIELGTSSRVSTFSLVFANPRIGNVEYHHMTVPMARRASQVLCLVETDEEWATAPSEALLPLKVKLSRPQGNHYGLIFGANLRFPLAEHVVHSDKSILMLLADITETMFGAIAQVN